MADGNVEIKIEPLDEEESTAMPFEEIIIKNEFDNNPETDGEKTNELITPKEEPLDDEQYLTRLVKAPQEPDPPLNSPNPELNSCKSDASTRTLTIHKRLRCREPNVCSFCGQVFRTRIILEDHMQQHREKAIKSAKTSPNSKRSLSKTPPKSSPETPPYSCKTCQVTFTSAQSFANHNRIHEGPKHICNKCGKSFRYLAELKKHNSGDTCVTEAVEEVLKNSIRIKEEVVSEDESSPQETAGTARSDVQKAMPFPSPMVIKQEPSEESVTVKEEPDDSFDYEELILKELIDRKAKSIAKVKASQGQTQPSRHIEKDSKPGSADKTDFEQVIQSTKLVVSPSKDSLQGKKTSAGDESNKHSISNCDEDQTHSRPRSPDKSQIIKSLKEEYQKAKKKKLDDLLTDDSSQNSLQAATDEVPSSLYFLVTGETEPYNQAVRTLKRTHMQYCYNWVCPSCPRRYIQRHGFVKHLLSSHHKTLAELEGKLFELKPVLFSLNVTNEDTYCSQCKVTLADAASLKKHRNEFHKKDTAVHMPYRCDKCGKFCSTRSTLGDHVLANCGTEPQYGCSECGKKFYTKSTLNLHKTMHTGELPHKCTYCEKRFRTRGQLTVHTRTHTGERPFPCKVCEKRFTHRETLIAHLSRHIDMKRYKCYGCQMFFSCISGLKTHRLTRMSTCGQFKLNARPVGPRVRVIKGNVIFEPQPKINPYFRRHDEESDESNKKNVLLQQNGQNVEEIENLYKKDSISVES